MFPLGILVTLCDITCRWHSTALRWRKGATYNNGWWEHIYWCGREYRPTPRPIPLLSLFLFSRVCEGWSSEGWTHAHRLSAARGGGSRGTGLVTVERRQKGAIVSSPRRLKLPPLMLCAQFLFWWISASFPLGFGRLFLFFTSYCLCSFIGVLVDWRLRVSEVGYVVGAEGEEDRACIRH